MLEPPGRALLAKPSGLRSLVLVRASGSTARVLNLALVHQQYGDTAEHASAPLLRTPALNRAMILKHVVRQAERDLFAHPPLTTTKIVVPFSAQELELGGRSLLFGEKIFERALREIAGSAHAPQVAADLDLLALLHSLPSFDPFLMRERLRQSGYEPPAVILRYRTPTLRACANSLARRSSNWSDSPTPMAAQARATFP